MFTFPFVKGENFWLAQRPHPSLVVSNHLPVGGLRGGEVNYEPNLGISSFSAILHLNILVLHRRKYNCMFVDYALLTPSLTAILPLARSRTLLPWACSTPICCLRTSRHRSGSGWWTACGSSSPWWPTQMHVNVLAQWPPGTLLLKWQPQIFECVCE